MKPRLKSSPAARELIKRHEPFRETAERGPDGRWVVGYGHRAAARDGIKVSREEAGLLLIYDVMQAEQEIDEIAPEPLARGQRDALISFVHDIGAEAFRRSDVARYLYEGRLRAAGEAIAAYGEASERREAESAHFLDALVPAPAGAVSRSQPVELVIKVEHPAEDRVLERAAAAPVEDYAPPPPPPPSARDISSRSEAEAEIARILAAVEAMPLEENGQNGRDAEAFAPVETAVADLSDEPVEAEYHAVDAGAGSETAASAEPGEATEPVAAAAGRERMPANSAEARVTARMSEEMAESPTPVTDAEVAAAAFEPPHGMDLGFVMTRAAAAPGDPEIPPNETPEVPQEPIPEIEPDPAPGPEIEPNPEPQPNPEPIPEIEPDPTPGIEPEPGPGGPTAAAPKEYVLERGVGLGYALTSVLQGRFALPPETAPAAAETVAEAPDETPVTAEQAEPVAPATEASGTEAPAGRPAEQAVTEIVERAVSAAVRDNPPPHPSESPAPASGAVGEVEGEPAVESEPAPEGDLLMDGNDPLMERDEFTPQDLAADIHPVDEPPAPSASDGGMAFLAALISGAVAAGVGGLGVYGDWQHIWTERDLTLELIVLLGGSFVMIGAGWQLASIWLSRLNEKSNV